MSSRTDSNAATTISVDPRCSFLLSFKSFVLYPQMDFCGTPELLAIVALRSTMGNLHSEQVYITSPSHVNPQPLTTQFSYINGYCPGT